MRRGRRFFGLVALVQPLVLAALLVSPAALHAWLSRHDSWLSVWHP